MENNISGVILAGGANKRFNGRIKAKMPVDGRSIISRMTDTIGKIFREIIIVTNTPEEFREFGNYLIVSDHFKQAGPLGGIHAALKASSGEACFVFAGDMPLLDEALIISQIEYYRSHSCDVLIPRVDKFIEPLHALYSNIILKDLEEYLSGRNDYAVREFFKKINVTYQQLSNSERTGKAFTNINLPSDIIAVEKMLDAR
jgi:molybdopterin-guanine dinucleotide biosynthesis protein A